MLGRNFLLHLKDKIRKNLGQIGFHPRPSFLGRVQLDGLRKMGYGVLRLYPEEENSQRGPAFHLPSLVSAQLCPNWHGDRGGRLGTGAVNIISKSPRHVVDKPSHCSPAVTTAVGLRAVWVEMGSRARGLPLPCSVGALAL